MSDDIATSGGEGRAGVLIVDDEPFFRKVIADTLGAAGFVTVEAAAGSETTTLIGRHEIGLVLTDLEMPDMSGVEVMRQVKAMRPEIPVVVISGHRKFSAVREVLSGGALDYLVKPFSDEELLAVVRRGLAHFRDNCQAIRHREEAERLLADLVLLREVGETASGGVDLAELVARIVDHVVAAVRVRTASLMLPDRNGNLRIVAAHGLPKGVREKTVVVPGEGLSGHVYATGEPVLLADILGDGRFRPSGDAGQYSTASALSLPLKGRERVLGVLNVNNKIDGSTFSSRDQRLLTTITHQASLAIENFSLVRELRTKARELEALNRARSRLVCNLSHELKTPLTGILGYSELLLSLGDQVDNREQEQYLQKIADSSLQMDQLISGMLQLFSIDSGTANWIPEPVSLAAICREEIGRYRDRIGRLGLQLDFAVDDDLPMLMVDREKLGLLIGALIDNAIKFNEPGGQLRLAADAGPDGDRSQLRMRVYNDGVNVPIDAADEIFAQYSQLGEINTAKPSGVGIGLALCRTIVEKMGGSIYLEDTEGVGTSFGLLLPVRTSRESECDERK